MRGEILLVLALVALYGMSAVLRAPAKPEDQRQFMAGMGCGAVLGALAIVVWGNLLVWLVDWLS